MFYQLGFDTYENMLIDNQLHSTWLTESWKLKGIPVFKVFYATLIWHVWKYVDSKTWKYVDSKSIVWEIIDWKLET